MPNQVFETLARTTERYTFVSSGSLPSTISCALRDRSDALVSSVAATSSGNGFYYAVLQSPGSSQWLVNEWVAVINANTYVNRQLIHVVMQEVD